MLLNHKLKASVETVFDYLSDMQKFVSVHPVIYKIVQTGGDSFLVYERLTFIFIPISFTYPVIIKKDAQNKVVTMHATVMKFTKIDLKFVLNNDGGYTLVKESIEIKSALPIAPFIKVVFKKQHKQLFENLALIAN